MGLPRPTPEVFFAHRGFLGAIGDAIIVALSMPIVDFTDRD
jgi:hypothetical protein